MNHKKVIIENIGKKFGSHWIFRNISYEFLSGKSYAILGANGSGKSTLLQIIAGNISANEGNIFYELAELTVSNDGAPARTGIRHPTSDTIFSHLSYAAPYLELPEEMTLSEIVKFHFGFKKMFPGFSEKKIIETIELEGAKNKQLKNFSSGMKQRVRLGLAILSATPILLLDEPSSNLDKNAVEWYRKQVQEFSTNRLIVICSNHQEQEYDFCNERVFLK